MLFTIIRTSEFYQDELEEVTKEINTLEELMSFKNEVDYPIIIQTFGNKLEIEIYDDYRE